MTEPRFKKGDNVLYYDIKAQVIKPFNKTGWFYTIRILKTGKVFNVSPSQIVTNIHMED